MDGVRDKLQQWGRWKLVQRAEDADLVIVLSSSEIAAGAISTAQGSATVVGNYASGNAVGLSAPFLIQKTFLTVVDSKSGNIYTAVDALARRHINGIPNYLVNRLKGQLEKHERRLSKESVPKEQR